jgi:hypothetical protein
MVSKSCTNDLDILTSSYDWQGLKGRLIMKQQVMLAFGSMMAFKKNMKVEQETKALLSALSQ